MEGHSSGRIDCKHAGAQLDVILECRDWICNYLQVGYLFFSVSFKRYWFEIRIRHFVLLVIAKHSCFPVLFFVFLRQEMAIAC